jgi:hypothetical protein
MDAERAGWLGDVVSAGFGLQPASAASPKAMPIARRFK